MGTTNPVYVISARIVMVEGNSDEANVRALAPKLRKTIDKDTVIENEKSKNTKNDLGSLLKFDMK